MTTRLRDTAERIASDEPLLLIEAPAGHGKTFQAAAAAGAMGATLERGQEILFLSHTNTASAEVTRRCPKNVRLTARTFDSLACEVVDTFSSYFRLSRPFRPGAAHLGQPSFSQIRRLACELLRAAPAIAAGLAWRHPVILADEYQDSCTDHHEMLWLLRHAGAVRVRLFADGLQRIFDFDGELVDWDALVKVHGTVSLEHGFRWDAQPELRDWLAMARGALIAGDPIPLLDVPPAVVLHQWEGAAPGPKQEGYCPGCYSVLRRLEQQGSCAWLVRERAHARGLAARLPHAVKLYEAGDLEDPLRAIEAAEACGDDAAALANLLIETLRKWGSGIPIERARDIAAVCTSDRVVLGKRTKVLPLAEICAALYDDPSVNGWLRAFRGAVEQRQAIGWKPIRRDAVYLINAVPDEADDPVLAVQALAQARRGRAIGKTAVMTVHKSKGREFDSVVVPYLSMSSFPDDQIGRRLLYVAMTRAQHQLHLLVPNDGGSALVRIA